MLLAERAGSHAGALLVWSAVAVCLSGVPTPENLNAQGKYPPPVLEVKTDPGDVKVFMDGVLLGRTNHKGRLRLTRLRRGLHKIRLTHAGYRSYEQDLQLREGEIVPLDVVLEKLPPSERASQPTSPAETSPENSSRAAADRGAASVERGVLRGLSVRGLTPAMRRALGLASRTQGVVIARVMADSPSGAAGLQKNDVIEQINRQPVHSSQVFVRLASQAGGQVVLRIHRRGTAQLVVVSENQ